MSAAAPASAASPLRRLVAAQRVTLGASRTVVTLPIYVALSAALLLPVGYVLVQLVPARGSSSFFETFLGSMLVAPRGVPQQVVSYFYFYLYLMSYLSIASVVGYEERRDRSIMFWKSLPVSDATWVFVQVATLFVGYAIGLAALLAINTVITAWESMFFIGLRYSDSGYVAYLGEVLAQQATFAGRTLFLLYLGMPFGVSLLWFAAFCRRNPSGYWLATFVSAYMLAFMVRFIGFDFADFLLWYPETFGSYALGVLRHGRMPAAGAELAGMVAAAAAASAAFGFLAWRSRRRAMPVS